MIYFTNDVESAGPKLGMHSTLSIGCALMTREEISFHDYWETGLVFYAELKPDSLKYELEALKVACSRLKCLEKIRRKDLRFEPESPRFNPVAVLQFMQRNCERPASAMKRFGEWLQFLRLSNPDGRHTDTGDDGLEKVVGVTNTVFFDGGRIDFLLGRYLKGKSPYGWSGLDLDSTFRGYFCKASASLKDLGLIDPRDKPHRADQDAVFMAMIGRELLFAKMGW